MTCFILDGEVVMESDKIEWGIIKISHPGFVTEGELVRLHRHKDNPLVIWVVESHKGSKCMAFMLYYEELEFNSEAHRQMYRMLYPNWAGFL